MDYTKTYIEVCDALYQNWKDVVTPALLQTQTYWQK
jgi:hypothetical protein